MNVTIVGHGMVGSNTAKIFEEPLIHDPDKGMIIDDFTEVHYAVVCVPTPSTGKGLDHSAVDRVLDYVLEKNFKGVFVVRSTCEPEYVSNLTTRYHSVIYWPEFLRERTASYDCLKPNLVVLGGTNYLTGKFREDLESINHGGIAKWALTDVITASVIKLGLNTALAAKVSVFNSIHEVSEKVGANWEMVRLSIGADPRIGTGQTNVPGPDGQFGFGGNCLPKDSTAFSNLVKDNIFLKSILSYNKAIRDTKDK
jgi:nucleotide sugar dehydrogenase